MFNDYFVFSFSDLHFSFIQKYHQLCLFAFRQKGTKMERRVNSNTPGVRFSGVVGNAILSIPRYKNVHL